MAKTSGRKPTSPLRDALRLFFRNKPAVFAAIAIALLAAAAISGELLTGKQPTPEEVEIIRNARHIGDKVDLERNSWAINDPLETILEDKLLPPLTTSEATGKFYLLGTDHLGRDVVSRLWAGSSISLTIGFLAVGIMVILGITLGGIAGFWGRQRVQLPFFAMLAFALGGAIAWGAEYVQLGIALLLLSGAVFLFQLFVVVIGRRWGALIIFGVVLAIFLGLNGYNMLIERTDPNGKVMQQARAGQALARETLLATRNFGHEVKRIEDRAAGARSEEWRIRRQHEIEILYRRLDVEKARFDLVGRQSAIELMERQIKERDARIRHLESRDRPDRAQTERDNQQRDVDTNLPELKQGLPALEQALEAANTALQTAINADPSGLTLQGSNALLERRALMRQGYLDMFRAEADKRFSEGLIGARLLNNHWRYPTYRVTRHFITATILWLALVVVVLMIAGVAQGAIQDIKGPLQKIFLPTMTVDDLVMRFTEIMITIPTLFLILAVLAMFERDVYIVMAVIGLTGWMTMTRYVRAEILSLREQDFIQAARALGVRDSRIIWRHLVPNAISPVLVAATIGVAAAVLSESTLSFLGIGAAPHQPTWGQILNDGRSYMTDAWWLMVIPGIAILITVLSFNLLGEGLREAFNPKLRGR